VKILQRRLVSLQEGDPFVKTKKLEVSSSNEEHLKMLRTGNEMIDKIFDQMHEIIDQARSSMKEKFRGQLVVAFQHKFVK